MEYAHYTLKSNERKKRKKKKSTHLSTTIESLQFRI